MDIKIIASKRLKILITAQNTFKIFNYFPHERLLVVITKSAASIAVVTVAPFTVSGAVHIL